MRTKFIKFDEHSVVDSNRLNRQFRNTAEDISELYKGYIALKNDVEIQNILNPYISDIFQNSINEINSKLEQVRDVTDKTYISFYESVYSYYPSSLSSTLQCRHEINYGDITLPIVSSDIEYHYINPETGEKAIIQNLSDFVKSFITSNRFKPKMDSIYENATSNALNQLTGRPHLVKALTSDSNIADVDLVYNLDLEETRFINTIKVNPLPELAVAFRNITLYGPSLTGQSLTDWEGAAVNFVDQETGIPLEKAKKTIFRFPDQELSSISVVLNNSEYKTVDEYREFVIGANLISIENNVYLNEGFFGLKIPCENKIGLAKLNIDYVGDPNKIDIYIYKDVETFNDFGTPTYQANAQTIGLMSTISVNDIDYIYVLFKIKKQDNGTTPVIKGCKIEWQK